MDNFDELMARKPSGFRVGGKTSKGSKEGVHARKVAAATEVLRGGLDGEAVRLKRDIYSLEEFAILESQKGLSDFLGKNPKGLDLELHHCKTDDQDDWEIPPTPWNASKAFHWLRRNATPDALDQIATELGWDDSGALAGELAQRLNRELHGESEPTAEEEAEIDELADELAE